MQADSVGAKSRNTLNRRLLRSGVWIVLLRVIGTLLGFVINVVVSHMLAPAAFGSFVVALNVINGGGLIARVGVDRSILKFSGRAFATGERSLGLKVIKLGLALATISAFTAATIFFFAMGPFLERLGLDSSLSSLLALGILCVAILQVVVESHRAFQEVRIPALLAPYGTGPVLNILFLLFLGFLFRSCPTLFSMVACYVGSIALLLPPALISLFRFSKRFVVDCIDPALKSGHANLTTSGMLLVSLSIAGTDVLQFCLSQSQVLIASLHCSADQVSLYATGRLLTTLVVTPLFLASQTISATIPELHTRQQLGELQRVLRTTATFAGIPTALLSLLFIMIPGPILALLFGDFYHNAGPILAALSVGGLAYVWTGPCATVLVLTGGHNLVLLVNMISAIVNVVGGLFVAEHYGVNGLAVLTASVQIISNVSLLFLARKISGVWTHPYFNFLAVIWPARPGNR